MKPDPEITVKTILMGAPVIHIENEPGRKSMIRNELSEKLIADESFLRRTAYKNTSIKTGESFFDDSDMKSEYYLVVVYDKKSGIPLLSSRYYFDRSVITRCLKGDHNTETELIYQDRKFNLDNFDPESIFLADRLSGNTTNAIYRQHRERIFLSFYSEIVRNNQGCRLLLMVRKEKKDKQLLKYLRMGFVPLGSTMHKGKEHSIILGDLRKYGHD